MKLWQVSLIGLLLFGAADKAFAQQTSVDVKRLPIDLAKVTRDLKQSAATESRSGLNLRYRVDVYGQAPRIEIFTKQDNLAYGPAPYGAPTHQEMIDHVTPQEYRAPAADIGNLIRWLTERSKK
ncbi:MAG TPA: hypothetical protein VFU28_22185 [Vicinamibacterales bacterium]|nr:hypothetical protein [Vicinamibacterales bacterium]